MVNSRKQTLPTRKGAYGLFKTMRQHVNEMEMTKISVNENFGERFWGVEFNLDANPSHTVSSAVERIADEDCFVWIEGLHIDRRVLRGPPVHEFINLAEIVGKIFGRFPSGVSEVVSAN